MSDNGDGESLAEHGITNQPKEQPREQPIAPPPRRRILDPHRWTFWLLVVIAILVIGGAVGGGVGGSLAGKSQSAGALTILIGISCLTV
jgi:hypothetical protein